MIELLKANKLTQAEIAAKSGMTQGRVSQIAAEMRNYQGSHPDYKRRRRQT